MRFNSLKSFDGFLYQISSILVNIFDVIVNNNNLRGAFS